MNSYEFNYIDSFQKSLERTTFEVRKRCVQREFFFESLVVLVNNAKGVNGRLFFVGNGASSAFSNHMALDWSKNGGLLSYSLSDSAMLTALSNDYCYEDAFVEFLRINGVCQKDIVVTISSSGNSKTILNVLRYCCSNNITTIGLSGLNEDNHTRSIAEYSLFVPSKTYGMVECIHQFFLHLWLDKSMNILEWEKAESQNMNINDFKL